MEEEEFEHIPWSNLLSQQDDRRTRMILLGVAVIAAAVLGYFAARYLFTSPGGTTVDLGPQSVVSTAAAPADNTVATVTTIESVPVASVPGLYSEADLMAVAPDAAQAAARMRAEWFVTDFFTVDGAGRAAEEVRAAFAPDLPIPELPQDHAAGDQVSYVEWARVFRVEPVGPSNYRVSVAFRTLVLGEDGYVRRPVLAVTVPIMVGEDGSTAVVDLPSPVSPPPAAHSSAAMLPAGEPPASVVSAVLAAASAFDSNPQVIGSWGNDERWRVLVELGADDGLTWPMAFRSDGYER